MVATILLTFAVMSLFMILMSIGLIFKGKELKGTCASKTMLLEGENGTCGICGQAVGSCKTEEANK